MARARKDGMPAPETNEAAKSAANAAPAGMHILELRIENIKRVKIAHIKPKGNVVVVAGRNGQGKSSVLDAIAWALTGTSMIPAQPIRKGCRTGSIKIDIGDFVVTRYFTKVDEERSKTGLTYLSRLVITGKHGEQYPSPQILLNELLGKISFDPLAFMRMKAEEQLETLRGLTKFDLDIDAIDKEQADDYQARREANREVESYKARLNTLAKPEEGLPSKSIDISALTEKLQNAANHNNIVHAQQQDAMARREKALAAIHDAMTMRENAAKLLVEAQELDGEECEIKTVTQRRGLSQRLQDEADNMFVGEEIDTAAVAAELNQANQTNAAMQRAHGYYEVLSLLRQAEARWNEIEERMTKRDQQRAASIGRAKMPLEGLSLGSAYEHYGSMKQEILYNGFALDQASYAEQIRVSMALGMASNPKLRVLRINDGSLLDDESMEVIGQLAHEHDYQVWIERVETGGKVSVIMEDGTASGEDVEAEVESSGGEKDV